MPLHAFVIFSRAGKEWPLDHYTADLASSVRFYTISKQCKLYSILHQFTLY